MAMQDFSHSLPMMLYRALDAVMPRFRRIFAAAGLTGVVDRLTASGLIDRRRSDSDRRVVYVFATPAGRELEERLMPEVAQVYAELKASLDDETWARLEVGLQSLAAGGGASLTPETL